MIENQAEIAHNDDKRYKSFQLAHEEAKEPERARKGDEVTNDKN